MNSNTEEERTHDVITVTREQGDGAPVAGISAESAEGNRDIQSSKKPFTLQLDIDLVQVFLTFLSFITRTWCLGFPRAVVFDELHFIKFVSLYIKRTFFFDVHPPLGKLLLAAAGKYAGFEGESNGDKIGQEYSTLVPVEGLRAFPAILGSLVVPIVYQICVEVGMSRYAAVVAGCMILLDNALLVQSRFMLMEGMLIFFSTLSVLAYLKFRNVNYEFGPRWWFWLCVCSVSSICSMSIKYTGFFTLMFLFVMITLDYWWMMDDNSKSDMCLVKHFLARLFAMIILPVALYLLIFYIHLTVLYKAGPHDNVMTSAFQASLEGGLASLTKGQPLYIAFGSQITLRHTENVGAGQPCWLHSHNFMYPVKYPDKRGSSHQQQVSCYVFKDTNNWWIVKHPDREGLIIEDEPVYVKHGDIIQLVHGISSRALNSHDVAAPLTPSNQEVSCYVNYNVSMPPQTLWRVEIVNRESDNELWQTIKSEIRLIHVNTTAALKTSGRQLPEWGFHQVEVTADRQINQQLTLWNVEEHRYSRSNEKGVQAAEFQEAEMIPLQPTQLSFWAKFYELQTKMLLNDRDAELEHKFSSSAMDWPLMKKNVAYWMSTDSNAQIHLIGNVVIWYASTISVVLYLLLGIFYLLRRRRSIFDISEAAWKRYILMAQLFVGGYLVHYAPFLLTERTIFLHHYLPAVPFKILCFAALGDHLNSVLSSKSVLCSAIQYGTMAFLAVAAQAFLRLSVFSYGNVSLTLKELDDLTWIDSWSFLHHN